MFILLLIYELDVVDLVVNKNIDFILVGYSYGGQICLFFFIYKNQFVKKYIYGFYYLEDEMLLIVYLGIGIIKISVCFGVLLIIELIELII